MSHLAYLEQMLEKEGGGGVAIGTFPKGWVYTKLGLSHPTPVTHSAQQNICKGYVGGLYIGLCPSYGGLFH